jgi:hypothetical protein
MRLGLPNGRYGKLYLYSKGIGEKKYGLGYLGMKHYESLGALPNLKRLSKSGQSEGPSIGTNRLSGLSVDDIHHRIRLFSQRPPAASPLLPTTSPLRQASSKLFSHLDVRPFFPFSPKYLKPEPIHDSPPSSSRTTTSSPATATTTSRWPSFRHEFRFRTTANVDTAAAPATDVDEKSATRWTRHGQCSNAAAGGYHITIRLILSLCILSLRRCRGYRVVSSQVRPFSTSSLRFHVSRTKTQLFLLRWQTYYAVRA